MNAAKKRFAGARIAALLLALCLPLQAGRASGAQADGIYTIDYQIVQAENDSVSMANDYWEKPATVVIDKGSVQIQMTINHSQWVTEFKVPGSGGGYVNTRILSKDAEADTRKVVFAVPELPSSPMLAKIHVTVPDIDYDHDYTIRFDFKADSLKMVEAAAEKPAAPTAKPQASVASTEAPQASAAATPKPRASATVTPSPQASAAATTAPGANAVSAGEQASPPPPAASIGSSASDDGASESPEQVAPSAEPSASAAAQAADAEANADAAEGNAGDSAVSSEAAGAAAQPPASPKKDDNGLIIGVAAAIVVLAAGGVWWWRRSRLQGR